MYGTNWPSFGKGENQHRSVVNKNRPGRQAVEFSLLARKVITSPLFSSGLVNVSTSSGLWRRGGEVKKGGKGVCGFRVNKPGINCRRFLLRIVSLTRNNERHNILPLLPQKVNREKTFRRHFQVTAVDQTSANNALEVATGIPKVLLQNIFDLANH